jgi:hypothetical protein
MTVPVRLRHRRRRQRRHAAERSPLRSALAAPSTTSPFADTGLPPKPARRDLVWTSSSGFRAGRSIQRGIGSLRQLGQPYEQTATATAGTASTKNGPREVSTPLTLVAPCVPTPGSSSSTTPLQTAGPALRDLLADVIVVLLVLAVVNAGFMTWSTALDAARVLAIASPWRGPSPGLPWAIAATAPSHRPAPRRQAPGRRARVSGRAPWRRAGPGPVCGVRRPSSDSPVSRLGAGRRDRLLLWAWPPAFSPARADNVRTHAPNLAGDQPGAVPDFAVTTRSRRSWPAGPLGRGRGCGGRHRG